MSLLAALRELQATHDNLRTIERDLGAFPPDLAALDQETKSIAKQLQEAEKSLQEWLAKKDSLARQLAEALKMEEAARKAMKAATQKVQYASAIRDLDERERQRASVARPLKEAEGKCAELSERISTLGVRSAEALEKFKELHQVFLAEHENQVIAKEQLGTRKTELEISLPPQDLQRFHRLLQTRQGRAVVPVQGATCTGCQVKLRMPFVSELRQKGGPMICESCQRIVFMP